MEKTEGGRHPADAQTGSHKFKLAESLERAHATQLLARAAW